MMARQTHYHLVDWGTLPERHRAEALYWEAVLWDVQDGMPLTPDEGAALASWLFGMGL
jgi:hypothetical protein